LLRRGYRVGMSKNMDAMDTTSIVTGRGSAESVWIGVIAVTDGVVVEVVVIMVIGGEGMNGVMVEVIGDCEVAAIIRDRAG